MRRDDINYLMVGSFVLAMLAVLIVGLYYITGRTGPADDYYVVYRQVAGIKHGTPVFFEGYQVGQVEDVSPLRRDDGIRYRVTLSVARDWVIPEDSVAQMMTTGLLAALSINIRQGQSGQRLAPGGEIEGREGGDMFRVINTVATDLNELARSSLRPLLDNLNNQVSRIAGYMDDYGPAILGQGLSLVEQLHASARHLDAVLKEVGTRDVGQIVSNARLTGENVAKASAQAVDVTSRGRAVADRLYGLAGDMDAIRTSAEALLKELRGVVGDNRENLALALRDLRHTLEVSSREVEQVAYHLKGTSRNMHEFSRQVRQNPGLLLGGRPPTDAQEVAK